MDCLIPSRSCAAIHGGGSRSKRNKRARLGREQALQPDQHAPQLAQFGALVRRTPAQQRVFDAVDLQGGLSHDAHQHIPLIVHEVVEQFHRRCEPRTLLDGFSQAVDRAQGARPGADSHPLADAHPQRGDLGRVEGEVVGDIVDNRNQVVLRILDAGGARTLLQGFEELRGECEVGLHPRLRGGVRQIEVQPDELGAFCGLPCSQPLDGLGKGQRRATR